ncbi:hypothetical protein Ciccas_007970 [Cichlidogyrus casuarinus]|uniref:Uncharacterized protein n=1 Tax=Cichlidogyrus casuarinus TaxID=1844966 RepID=A0ABD2Q1C4_9PLAT
MSSPKNTEDERKIPKNSPLETRLSTVPTLKSDEAYCSELDNSSIHEKLLADSTTPDKSNNSLPLTDANKSLNKENGAYPAYMPITGPNVGMSPSQNSRLNDFDQGHKHSQLVYEPSGVVYNSDVGASDSPMARRMVLKSWLCDTTASDTEESENVTSVPEPNSQDSLPSNKTLIESSILDDLKCNLNLDIARIRVKMDSLRIFYKNLKNELTLKESSLQHLDRASRPTTPNLESHLSKSHRKTDGSISKGQFSRPSKTIPMCTTSTQIESHEFETLCDEFSKSTLN